MRRFISLPPLTSRQHNLKARGSGAPYEFRWVNSLLTYNVPQPSFISTRAIESILLSVLSALEAEMVFIRNLVGGLLAELEDDINHDKFKRLLHYSRRLAAFKNRATLVGIFFTSPLSPLLSSSIGPGSTRRSVGARLVAITITSLSLFIFYR